MGIGGLVLWFRHELRNPDLGMANRKEAERFAACFHWHLSSFGMQDFPFHDSGMQAYQDFVR